jgi:ketosteroid isomerase-like protein
MFDVPPQLYARGLDTYMPTWESFFSRSEKPVAFDFHDVKITAGEEVAFSMAKDGARAATRTASGKSWNFV